METPTKEESESLVPQETEVEKPMTPEVIINEIVNPEEGNETESIQKLETNENEEEGLISESIDNEDELFVSNEEAEQDAAEQIFSPYCSDQEGQDDALTLDVVGKILQ